MEEYNYSIWREKMVRELQMSTVTKKLFSEDLKVWEDTTDTRVKNNDLWIFQRLRKCISIVFNSNSQVIKSFEQIVQTKRAMDNQQYLGGQISLLIFNKCH